MEKKLIPYSVYLPAEYVNKLKDLAKERKASELIRNAVMMIIDAHDAYTAGYNQGLDDASQVIYDCQEAQMIAVKGKDLGAHLCELIKGLKEK
jgi:predicted transcriptional regulator